MSEEEVPPPKKNKYEVAEIEFIQQEIQLITKKIEREKITLRILKERYDKQKSELAKLEGRPGELTKDQKQAQREERQRKLKKHSIFESAPNKSKKVNQPHEEHILIQKSTAKSEIELENITKGINHQVLENKDLTNQIKDLRKDRVRILNKLNSLQETNKKIEANIESLVQKNKESVSRIQFEELNKTKEVGVDLQRRFEIDRDVLEGKYHEIIETNIKRERENKRELSKKRLMLGMIAESVKPSKDKSQNSIFDQLKRMENDDITDRTPILDVLIDKWKYITKYKKSMIDKYIQNSSSIKEALNKMMLFLGIDNLNELPTIFEKTEEQMKSIELYNNQLDNEIGAMERKKELLSEQIQKLNQEKIKSFENKSQSFKEKNLNITKLTAYNRDLVEAIEKKRTFFSSLQEHTIKFINKAQSTYLSDFVPEKITIDVNTKINEANIIEFLSCIEYYVALMTEFEKNNAEMMYTNYEQNEVLSNKELDKLKKEINSKLEQFKYDNYINNNVYLNMKNEIKMNSFDDTIKKMARVIAEHVNDNEAGVPFKMKKPTKLMTNIPKGET